MHQTVHIALPGRAYDVRIGSGVLSGLAAEVKLLRAKSVGIVTDHQVGGLYLEQICEPLRAAGLIVGSVSVPAGEASKSFSELERVCDALLEMRLERGDVVVALGGGVVGDLAGFAAAILRRGVRFIQLPTSLLAQVDSSVGGKTGINSALGKNLIGAFHQPSLVLADTDVLATLSRREFAAGYAEILKCALVGDTDFFEFLENYRDHIFSGGAARGEAIARSVAFKGDIVVRDEKEQGDRALLNLGHTFGHALEVLSHYDSRVLIHGEAVAIGLVMAAEFSHHLGYVDAELGQRIKAHLRAVGLPATLADLKGAPRDLYNVDQLLGAMMQDKKVQDGAPTFILLKGIGQGFVARGVELDRVRTYLMHHIGQAHES
jgi:shikimate kinase / 3-dehydroquinate synthase